VIWRPGEKAAISGTQPGKSLISPEPEWRP